MGAITVQRGELDAELCYPLGQDKRRAKADLKAADDVQLELPETGGCSTDFLLQRQAPHRPSVADAGSCCVLDELEKAKGQAGLWLRVFTKKQCFKAAYIGNCV